MNSANETIEARSRKWAADQLGANAASSPAQAKSAFLKRLESAHFLPPETWFHALNLLDPSTHPAENGAASIETEMHAQQIRAGHTAIDQFAARFWEMNPPERREQWQTLLGRYAAEPALAARLQKLQPGLGYRVHNWTLKAGALPDQMARRVKTLMEQVVEWFPLAPAVKAAKRRDWLATIKFNEMWGSAAKLLVQHNPGLTALDPELIAFLSSDALRLQKVEATVNARKRVIEDIETAGSGNGKSWFSTMVIIGLCLGVLKAFTSSPSRSTTSAVGNPLIRKNMDESWIKKKSKTDFSNDVFEWNTTQQREYGITFPEFFESDGTPKIIDRSSGLNRRTPGFAIWQSLGGKYRDELDDSRAPSKRVP